jgi:membrane protein
VGKIAAAVLKKRARNRRRLRIPNWMRLRDFPSVLMESAGAWMEDNALRLSASVAFYSIFSLAPLLVIAVSIAALIFNEQTVRDQVSAQLEALAGPRAADALEALLITTAAQKRTGTVATIAGVVVLLFGASGVFAELKDALNTIWGVVVKPGRTLIRLIRDRFMSFSMVLSIGFLLLVSLLLSAILTALSKYMNWLVPLPAFVWQALDLLGSLSVITVLFAMIFKILPNVRIGWNDVWMGAVVTSLLFVLGKFVIGFYLGASSITSAYGAAASVVIVLLWVYYSACVLFFGAELTKVYACKFGSGIIPNHRAMLWSEAVRTQLLIEPR